MFAARKPGGSLWEAVAVPTDAASWDVGTPAFVLADVSPTLPLTIVGGVNDTFNYTPNGGSAELFTVAPGILTTVDDCVAAMAASTGSGSGERFDTKITLSNSSGWILATSLSTGQTSNGDTITEGDGAAATLGFTGNPNTFGGGTGSIGSVDFSVPGQITLGGHSGIASKSDEYGTAWTVEAEMLLAAGSSAAFQAVYDSVANGVTDSISSGSGFYNVAPGAPGTLQGYLAGVLVINGAPSLAVGSHTIRFDGTTPYATLMLDGSIIGQGYQYGLLSLSESSRFALGNSGTDPVTFSNLKAWRIPVPS